MSPRTHCQRDSRNIARAPALTELILAEQSCCGFLNFSLTFTGPTIALTVTGPEHAQPLIAELAGARNHLIGVRA